jgi:tetratricopeptide (TPR) repeat protein
MADASALWKLGRASRDQDHLKEAIGYFEQALAGFRQLGKLEEQEEVLDDLGNVYRDYGTVQRSNELREKGIVCFQESLSIAQRLGDRSGQAVSLGNIGLGYYSLGDLDRAVTFLEQSAAMFRELGERAQFGRTLAYLGRAQGKAVGRGDEGVDTLRQSITILREVGDRYAEAEALDGLGRAYRDRGRYGEAQDCFEQRRTIYQELGKPPPLG